MNSHDYDMAWALANFLASMGVFFICFCRVTATNRKVLKRVRAKFALLGSAYALFGFSPIWGQFHGAVGFFVSLASVAGLLAETYQWGKGAPESVKFHPDEAKESE